MIVEVQRRRFSVDEYHRMAAAGILHEDDRVELIEGEYWLVDLTGGAIEVYRAPSPDGYRDLQRRSRGEQVAPAACPDVTIAVGDVVG